MAPSVPKVTRSSFMLSIAASDLFSITKFKRQRLSASSMLLSSTQHLLVRRECADRQQCLHDDERTQHATHL